MADDDAARVWASSALAVARKRRPLGTSAQLWAEGHDLLSESAGVPEHVRVEASVALYEQLFPGRLLW